MNTIQAVSDFVWRVNGLSDIFICCVKFAGSSSALATFHVNSCMFINDCLQFFSPVVIICLTVKLRCIDKCYLTVSHPKQGCNPIKYISKSDTDLDSHFSHHYLIINIKPKYPQTVQEQFM